MSNRHERRRDQKQCRQQGTKSAALNPQFLRIHNIAQPKLLELARQGRVLEFSFQAFAGRVYPCAPASQLRELKIAFFAGAQEFLSCQMMASDLNDGVTDQDESFFNACAKEIETFHRRTIERLEAEDAKRKTHQ